LNRLEVKASKTTFVLVILLGLFFIPMGLVSLLSGLLKGFNIVPFGIGLMCLILFGVVVWLILRGHGKSVKYFSDEGLVRNDGRSFAWTDLSRVVDQFRIPSLAHQTKIIWRTEIQFRNGESAWLIPTKISNYREVNEFVRNLPCEHTEFRV
jgi:hypothetical protein